MVDKKKALAILSDAYEDGWAIFDSGMNDGELSPTKAGEFLMNIHDVPEEDAFQWSFDWVTEREARQ